MWVMTSFGIFMPSLRPAEHVPAGDQRLLQIRARRHRELAILKHEYMPNAGEIIHLPFTDYEYRIYCTHEEWAQVMAQLARDIDYVKFKDTTSRYKDDKLHTAYLRIWNTLYTMFSTNSVFDVKFTAPVKGKKNRKGKKGKRSSYADTTYDLIDYDDPRNWWDDVPSVEQELLWATLDKEN